MKKTFLFFLFGVFVFSACGNNEKYVEDERDESTRAWMGGVDGSMPLAALSLPGTHDSGARYGGSLAQCQTMGIAEQLDAGIRFLDVRLKLKGDKLQLFHGIANQKIDLDELLDVCYEFMSVNPSEAIIISIKNEDDPVDDTKALEFEMAVNLRINADIGKWFIENRLPVLNEVRGKMVLFRRYKATQSRGVIMDRGWADDAVFSIGADIKIQDKYKTKADKVESEKWILIKKHLGDAIEGEKSVMYLNFMSATGGVFGVSPKSVALGGKGVERGVVDLMTDYLKATKDKKRMGCVIFDFPSKEVIDLLIETNF